jgi:hypothetical protein
MFFHSGFYEKQRLKKAKMNGREFFGILSLSPTQPHPGLSYGIIVHYRKTRRIPQGMLSGKPDSSRGSSGFRRLAINL